MSQWAANTHSLLLPVETGLLLLPNAAVAEIVDYREPEAVEGAPDWFLGRVPWRGLEVPLLAFEAVDADVGAGAEQGLRIAILNTLNGAPELPFIAIVLRGIPRLLSAGAEIAAVPEAAASGSVTLSQVQVAGEFARIPDLDALERLVAELPPAA